MGLGCLQLFTAKVCLSLLSVKDRNRVETQSGGGKHSVGASGPGQMADDKDLALMLG